MTDQYHIHDGRIVLPDGGTAAAGGDFAQGGPASTGAPANVAGNAAEPLFDGQAARKQYRVQQSSVPEDAWRELDELMVMVAQGRLNLFERLQAAGLIDPVDLGTVISTWQETNEFGDAETSMDGRPQTDEDASRFEMVGVPVPLHTKGFRFGHRQGDQMNVVDTNAPKSIRKVLEAVNDTILDGWDQNVADGRGDTFSIDGVRTLGDRAQTSVSGSWDTTPGNVDSDVRDMIGGLEDNNYYGPYDLWLAGDVAAALRAPSPDFDNMRLRQQVGMMDEIDEIVTTDRMPDGEAVLVQLDRDVIDGKLVNGTVTDSVEWDSTPFETRVKVWSGFAPRVKSDEQGQAGINHVTGLTS